MKKIIQNPLDKLFRDSLKSPDLKYDEQDWQSLEKLLFKKSQKSYLPVWRMLSGIAAVSLIFLLIWFLRQAPLSEEKNKNVASDKIQNLNKSKEVESKPASDSGKMEEFISAKDSGKNKNSLKGPFSTELVTGNRVSISPVIESDFTDIKYVHTLKANNQAQLNTATLKIISSDLYFSSTDLPENKPTEKNKTKNFFSKMSLSFSVSPDLNSAGNFNNSKLGSSFGIGVGYRLNNFLSINTGAYYSKKTYSANPDQYKTTVAPFNYANYASSIDADCRVMDVPVNLNFNILSKPKGSLFAGIGISSYFMLKEKYTFIRKKTSGYPLTGPEPSYTIENNNKYILSVLNVAAGLSKPISNNLDMVIQPYAKLPLTGIGQGKINLQSAGVSFQLNYKFQKKLTIAKPIY